MYYTDTQIQMQNHAYNAAWQEMEEREVPHIIVINGRETTIERLLTRKRADELNEVEKKKDHWVTIQYKAKQMEAWQ